MLRERNSDVDSFVVYTVHTHWLLTFQMKKKKKKKILETFAPPPKKLSITVVTLITPFMEHLVYVILKAENVLNLAC